MPNTHPPHPEQPRRGRKSHPIDIQVAETLKSYPGQRSIYPTDARWPDEEHNTPDAIRDAANRIRARAHHKWGAFAPDDHGRFRIKAEPKSLRIYIWYELHQ